MTESVRDNEDARIARAVRIGRLLETYGPLLTERQREFVRLHYHEDLSFGEIARDASVSRQAVHDAVRQAETAMEHYETSLRLLGRSITPAPKPLAGETIPETARGIPASGLEPIIEKLDALRRRLASQGIIYDTSDYVRKCDEVLADLRRL